MQKRKRRKIRLREEKAPCLSPMRNYSNKLLSTFGTYFNTKLQIRKPLVNENRVK